MKISYNWLKQYINIDKTPDEISKILTGIGLEVESLELHQTVKGGLNGLVIGEVKTCVKHPQADKLSLTTVDVGGENLLSIVCGAPNVAAGQKVVVATVGTKLYKGDEEFEIKKAKIRGELSEGMICAEDEIGIGTSHDGIIVLDSTAKIGSLAKEYYNIHDDYVLEVAITPNHSDATSHFGVARDLFAAIKFLERNGQSQSNVKLIKPSVDNFTVDNCNYPVEIIIENAEACPRYSGVTVSGIKVSESPDWLKERLIAIDQKPINNVVDITNFVLHELGQPLHAFDADKIKGKKVIIKTMPEQTPFVTLDNMERKLSNEDLMICNADEGMCIAGVFGGIHSGISNETTNVFIESAYFNAGYIRKTSKRHALQTDASYRFERGTNPDMTVYAMKRAALLIKEIAGGTISSDIMDVYPNPVKPFRIVLPLDYADKLIGKKIDVATIVSIFESLEIKVIETTNESITVDVPPYKVDVQRPADLVEEILRIYGYNNIEFNQELKASLSYSQKPDNNKIKNKMSDWLSSKGFNEMMCNSLTKANYYDEMITYPTDQVVRIMNPLSTDLNALRQTLLFGGLESILFNRNRKNQDLKFYEFGNCYQYVKNKNIKTTVDGYLEQEHLALFISGNKDFTNWISKEEKTNFYYLKSYTDALLERLNFNLDKITVEDVSNDIFNYGLKYLLNDKALVEFGIVNKKLTKQFDIGAEVYYADFFWSNILTTYDSTIKNKELSRFPDVRRDLALMIDKNIKFEQIKELAYKTEKKLLKQVNIFDVYEGEKIGVDYKSYAVTFILQDEEKTLTDNQIDKIMNNLINVYQKQLGAMLR